MTACIVKFQVPLQTKNFDMSSSSLCSRVDVEHVLPKYYNQKKNLMQRTSKDSNNMRTKVEIGPNASCHVYLFGLVLCFYCIMGVPIKLIQSCADLEKKLY